MTPGAKENLSLPFIDKRFQVPFILAVGRLTADKDYPTLLRAFAILKKRHPIQLLILGEGEQREYLESFIKDLNIQEDVFMPGFVDNPYIYMKNASLFVLSSACEGFGNVIVEAMACGTPVVSTDCPAGPSEILENGRWGKLVPVGDEKALAEAMEETLAKSNRLDVVERAKFFSVKSAVEQHLELLFGHTMGKK